MSTQDRIDRTVAAWPSLTDAQKARVRTVLLSDVQGRDASRVVADTPIERSALDELLEEK